MSPEITKLNSVNNEAADLIKASMLDLLPLPSSRLALVQSRYAIVQLPCRKGPGTHWAPSAALLSAAATCSLPFAFSER
jgi:hypothetical protein